MVELPTRKREPTWLFYRTTDTQSIHFDILSSARATNLTKPSEDSLLNFQSRLAKIHLRNLSYNKKNKDKENNEPQKVLPLQWKDARVIEWTGLEIRRTAYAVPWV